MEPRIQAVALLGAILLLALVIEFVRRRRLLERYALLWIFSAVVLLILAAFRPVLLGAANTIGIYYPPSALFFIAFGFVLALLLHFSLAVSRLSDQSRILAQRLAQLERQVHARLPSTGDEAAPRKGENSNQVQQGEKLSSQESDLARERRRFERVR